MKITLQTLEAWGRPRYSAPYREIETMESLQIQIYTIQFSTEHTEI